MGLGKFQWRLILIIIVILLLWQSSKVWLIFGSEESLAEAQVAANQRVTVLYKDDIKSQVQKIQVGIYYETLCPDSRSFFLKQLLPTYNRLKENMQLEFVPYGKAETVRTNEGYEFTCQHGTKECQGNIIHACSIEVIKTPSVLLNFLACMIKNNLEPVNIMETCAQKMDVDSNAILSCYQGVRGQELLAKYGEMTKALEPKVAFIPTITLDGSSEGLPQILKNLLHEICLKLKVIPEGCKT